MIEAKESEKQLCGRFEAHWADPAERKGLEDELGRWMSRRFEMAIMDMR